MQTMPRWLSLAYRLTTALVLLMLIAALISLFISVLLGVDSLWNWGLLRVAAWRGLLAHL